MRVNIFFKKIEEKRVRTFVKYFYLVKYWSRKA